VILYDTNVLIEFYKDNVSVILKTAVEHSKIPFALSLSKGERGFGMLTKWVSEWKPLMLRQAQHERLPLAPTAVFKVIQSLRSIGVNHIAVSVITKAELFYGARNKKEMQRISKALPAYLISC